MVEMNAPYRKDERSSSAENKRQATTTLCALMKGPILSVKEFLGGYGIQAEVFLKELAPEYLRIQDFDPECVKRLHNKFRRNKRVIVSRQDMFEDRDNMRYDLTVLDFNCFTLLKYQRDAALRRMLHRAVCHSSRYVMITDVASYRIWINWPSYGCQNATYESYVDRLTDVVWNPLGFDYIGRAGRAEATYLLFGRSSDVKW